MSHLTSLTIATILLAAAAIPAQACNIKLYQGTEKHPISPKIPASMLARNDKHAPLGAGIVGLWHVVHNDNNGNLVFESFEQWHSDGTEFEFANGDPSVGDICMGTWQQNGKSAQLWHTGWTFNSDGSSSGTLVLTGSDKVAKDGNSFKGPFDIKLYDVDGNLLAEIPGTTVAERLSVH
jgi:hypothetical protein